MKKLLRRKSSTKSVASGSSGSANTNLFPGSVNDSALKLKANLPEEVLDLESESDPCSGLSFRVGVSEAKNGKYRRTMEDVHTYVANFAERLDWGYFGVFDGHAGKETARWCGSHLHELIYDSIQLEEFGDLRDTLNESFLRADKEISKLNGVGQSGCTASVAILRWEVEQDELLQLQEETEPQAEGEQQTKKQKDGSPCFDFVPSKNHKRMLYTANVGDSKIVVARGKEPYCLTYEHKASDKNEVLRISQQGGLVLGGRVNGVLAVSRSLGDVGLKQWVIGNPFTTTYEITDADEYIIIACDGLWDVCSESKAVAICRGKDAQKAADSLMKYAIENGTTDNVTVLVVKLDRGVFEQDWEDVAEDDLREKQTPKDDDDAAPDADTHETQTETETEAKPEPHGPGALDSLATDVQNTALD